MKMNQIEVFINSNSEIAITNGSDECGHCGCDSEIIACITANQAGTVAAELVRLAREIEQGE